MRPVGTLSHPARHAAAPAAAWWVSTACVRPVAREPAPIASGPCWSTSDRDGRWTAACAPAWSRCSDMTSQPCACTLTQRPHRCRPASTRGRSPSATTSRSDRGSTDRARAGATRCWRISLAHVMQQAGASRSAEQLRDGSPEYEAFENEADTAAAVFLAGLRSGLTRAVAPTVPAARQIRSGAPAAEHQTAHRRRLRTPASGSGSVEEPLTGEEFCIRTVMQGHAITREEAQPGTRPARCTATAGTRRMVLRWIHQKPIRCSLTAPGGKAS